MTKDEVKKMMREMIEEQANKCWFSIGREEFKKYVERLSDIDLACMLLQVYVRQI